VDVISVDVFSYIHHSAKGHKAGQPTERIAVRVLKSLMFDTTASTNEYTGNVAMICGVLLHIAVCCCALRRKRHNVPRRAAQHRKAT